VRKRKKNGIIICYKEKFASPFETAKGLHRQETVE
jgi:hypothetical protein